MLSKVAVYCASWVMLTSGLTAFADSPNASTSVTSVSVTSPSVIPTPVISAPVAPASVAPASVEQSPIAPSLIARRVQKDLATRLNVPFHTLEVVEAERKTWPDSCLGLASTEEQCQSGGVRGWQIKVRSAQQTWTYRSDRAAMRLRMEPLSEEASVSYDFSAGVSQRLLETVSQQTQEPMSTLQVLGVQPAVWNGCMGITEPETICTQSVIEGFRVIVGDERFSHSLDSEEAWNTYYVLRERGELEREWVYHISADGTQIVRNDSATSVNFGSSTFFAVRSNQYLPKMRDDAVFQVVYDSSFGFTDVTTLADDGTIFYEKIARSPSEESIPEEALSEISLAELAEFKQLLEKQQFSNLNGIAFSNDDPGLATEGSIYLRTVDTTVALSADEDALPSQLQVVMKALRQFLF